MEIILKNVKIGLAFSEETICFNADIYVDGKEIGYAKNDGHGGSTDYNVYDIDKRPTLKLAEEFCLGLPPYVSKTSDFTLPMNLEMFIDDIIDKEVKKIEDKKEAKKIETLMLKHIVFKQKNGNIAYLGWKKITIAQLLKVPNGQATIIKKIAELKAEGSTILNTNLPTNILV